MMMMTTMMMMMKQLFFKITANDNPISDKDYRSSFLSEAVYILQGGDVIKKYNYN